MSSKIGAPILAQVSKKLADSPVKDLLSSIDEAPDFLNPYSDLNLFLSQKIKQQMRNFGCAKKWSHKIQEELVQKITPEFQMKFPHYRLGVAALRKTWEKIAYYLQQIQDEKDAITQDGKLNLHFFIKENLKQYPQLKNHHQLHPYHYAHQLAVKMSECLATIDGIRPKLDHLTKTIWAVQRHLLSGFSPEEAKCPYDEYDKIDKLIVKIILEITAKQPQISQSDLEHKVRESIQSLHDLPSFASLDTMTCNVSALLAEKLYAASPLHTCFLDEQKQAILSFVRRQVKLCKASPTPPPLTEVVRRVLALYSIASQLPRDLSESTLKSAVQAVYSHIYIGRPDLPQALYAFISAEMVLARDEQDGHSLESVCEAILSSYREVQHLPLLKEKWVEMLEIVIWKVLSETEGLLEKLPYRIGQRIEEEIANTLIDNPQQNFSGAVHLTVQLFKRIKELAIHKQMTDIERKIHTWTIQGDMLCRCIRLDPEAPLLKMICEKWRTITAAGQKLSHVEFVSEICQAYLKKHPDLSAYAPQVTLRIWILYKYTWYNLFADPHESSFDRFLKWHRAYLLSQAPLMDEKHILHKLEELCKKSLPLTPFDPAHCQQILVA